MKNIKIIAFMFIQFLFLNTIEGQTIENPEKLKLEVKKQAEKMLTYFYKKKYKSFSTYTLPSLIEKMGVGRDINI